MCRACAWQIAIDADDWDGHASYADDEYEAIDAVHASDADADGDATMTDEDVDAYASVADVGQAEEEEERLDCGGDDGSVNFSDASEADTASGADDASDAETVSEEDTDDDDDDDWNPLSCPLCRTKSGFGPLVEEPIESNP